MCASMQSREKEIAKIGYTHLVAARDQKRGNIQDVKQEDIRHKHNYLE